MIEAGSPKEYPLVPIATELGENDDFDEFVRKLCDEISETAEVRAETLELIWEDCEKNYWATGGPENPRESELDFTITFETCKQASSNLTNPILAQDTVLVAKARPGFPTIAATHDILLDWMTDQYNFAAFINDLIRHAQIYTKATVKSPWIRKTRVIKFWERDQAGGSSESEREDVVKEGSFPYLVDPRRIYHPIPCVSVDEAPWWAEKIDTNPAEIKKKRDDGYYRADVNPYAIGDKDSSPEKDKETEELYIANAIEAGKTVPGDRTKVHLFECYTTYEGAECVIILDLDRRTWLAAHGPFYQEFPRPYETFCWHQVVGSVDGKSLCGVTDQLHRAYVAIMNILLDAGIRSIEPLVLAAKELGLSEMIHNGRLGPGLQEVESLVMEKLSDGIHEIKLTTGQVSFLIELLARIEKHMRDASSIPPAFYGEEVAQRPTATGTTSVLEKAMQPLYELMSRLRPTIVRVAEIQYSQLRQFKPKNLRIFIDAQNPQEKSMLEAMLIEFPPGYWRDQVLIETKVNSQTMSKSIKKQEALAMVDKWPELARAQLELMGAATSGGPISFAAGNALDIFDLVLAEWLTEFELPEVRDAVEIQGTKMAGEAVAQAQQQLISIIEDRQRRIVDLEAQVVDLGGEVPPEPEAGGQPGGSGPSQAAA